MSKQDESTFEEKLAPFICIWGSSYLGEDRSHCRDCSQYQNAKCLDIEGILALLASRDAAQIQQKDEALREARVLLAMAKCPDCDGSGAIYRIAATSQLVTHNMASDTGMPELEGSTYSPDNFEVEQCQWCYKQKQALAKIDQSLGGKK